jgi:carbamoyltransferase
VDYLVNPKGLDSPHMLLAFQTTSLGKDSLKAAMHPHDGTVRPQILDRDDNPGYYDLIAQFEALTGVGALLNTSFNLHGEPMVCSPEDAVSTFARSGLEILALDDLILSKKELAHYTMHADGVHHDAQHANSASG